MTEDIFILDCHTEVYVWVGQQVDPKKKPQVLDIGEVFKIHSTRYRLTLLVLQIFFLIVFLNRNSLSTISS